MTRLVVTGGDVDGNLGDRAILEAICFELRQRLPGCEITVVCSNPERLESTLGVHALPRGICGFLQLCRVASRSHGVLCGGGGLFQDDDSLVKMPYWALRIALLRLFCRPVIGLSLGVGPLRATSSRLFARLAFRCMDRISVRDPEARRLAQPLSCRHVELMPDPALLISPVPRKQALTWLHEHGVPTSGKTLLGVSARRWFPPAPRMIPHKPRMRSRRYAARAYALQEPLITLLARTLDRLVERRDVYPVFLPTYRAQQEADDQICERIQQKMQPRTGTILRIEDPALFKGVTGELGALLGGRMHPTIFAASMGTPVVGLAYNAKFDGFFELLEKREHVLDIESFVQQERIEDLCGRIEQALDTKECAPTTVDALAALSRSFFDSLARSLS